MKTCNKAKGGTQLTSRLVYKTKQKKLPNFSFYNCVHNTITVINDAICKYANKEKKKLSQVLTVRTSKKIYKCLIFLFNFFCNPLNTDAAFHVRYLLKQICNSVIFDSRKLKLSISLQFLMKKKFG